MKSLNQIERIIEEAKPRGAWTQGVQLYAYDLIDTIRERIEWEQHEPATIAELEEYALNGAKDWKQYSEGGCALCYDGQIAERLCNPSEYQRTFAKGKDPNPRESWIDCQSRALYQAWMMIRRAAE